MTKRAVAVLGAVAAAILLAGPACTSFRSDDPDGPVSPDAGSAPEADAPEHAERDARAVDGGEDPSTDSGDASLIRIPVACTLLSGDCKCPAAQRCTIDCPDGGCNVTCETSSDCDVKCPDCNTHCASGAICTYDSNGSTCTADPGAMCRPR